jgi:hypothetical protein
MVPLLCDAYSKNRTTGSFILIDEERAPRAAVPFRACGARIGPPNVVLLR